MRMMPTDIADIGAPTYTFLINGRGPGEGMEHLFRPCERVRLRVINGSAQTFFNLRIPGLAISVIATDGQPVRPVKVDELQIGAAETYDVIVEPGAAARPIPSRRSRWSVQGWRWRHWRALGAHAPRCLRCARRRCWRWATWGRTTTGDEEWPDGAGQNRSAFARAGDVNSAAARGW